MGRATALLLGGTIALFPAIAAARTPLPTLEVVQPERKRVRLLDVRGAVQLGYGYALARRSPVLAPAMDAQISFVELSARTQLHVALGMSGLVDVPGRSRPRTGMVGAEVGLGLSRHAPNGPALVATISAGPRWEGRNARPIEVRPTAAKLDWRVDGWGVVGRIDAYPFYLTIPEIQRSERHWFRKYVLSGLHVWAAARWDAMRTHRGPTYLGGVGLDFGRTLLLPILQRLG